MRQILGVDSFWVQLHMYIIVGVSFTHAVYLPMFAVWCMPFIYLYCKYTADATSKSFPCKFYDDPEDYHIVAITTCISEGLQEGILAEPCINNDRAAMTTRTCNWEDKWEDVFQSEILLGGVVHPFVVTFSRFSHGRLFEYLSVNDYVCRRVTNLSSCILLFNYCGDV